MTNQPKSCPLCGSSRILLHRWHEVTDVRAEWKNGFGFDPFDRLDVGSHLVQYRCSACDLRFYYPAICGDGKFYKELSDRFIWYYEKNKWEFDVAAELISELKGVQDILEVGCGQGHFLVRMQNLYNCQGVEFNPQAIQDCKANGLNVSSKDLNAIDACFDVVAAFEVLEHLSNPRDFIDQALRVLKPGGYLLLAVPDPDSYFAEAERVLLDMPPHHVLSLSKKTFKSLEKLFPLEIVQILQEPLRFPHYKSYISNFLSAEVEPGGRVPLLGRVMRKLFGIDVGRERRRLVERLTELQMATSYQSTKDKLQGQTHLVLFRKN